MTQDLSLLCVTRAEPYARAFFDRMRAVADACGAEFVVALDTRAPDGRAPTGANIPADTILRVRSQGYVESVLDEAVGACARAYVLRLDDDETCSPAMAAWLAAGEYRAADHWKFCTANLWRDDRSVPLDLPLWPDHHTRLSVRAKAGGRHYPHSGSPFGGGTLAPVIHCHHKFLVKTFAERQAIAARYDAFAPGYGTSDGLRPFSLPETCYERLRLAPLGDGTIREWRDDEIETVEIGVPA